MEIWRIFCHSYLFFSFFLKRWLYAKYIPICLFSLWISNLERAKERAAIETSQFWPREDLEAAKPLEVPGMYTTPAPPDVTRRNSWPSTLQRTVGSLEGWVLWKVSSTVPLLPYRNGLTWQSCHPHLQYRSGSIRTSKLWAQRHLLRDAGREERKWGGGRMNSWISDWVFFLSEALNSIFLISCSAVIETKVLIPQQWVSRS